MARTLQQRIDALDQLIADLEAGRVSEFQEGTERWTTHDLPKLYARYDQLVAQQNRQSRGILRPIRTGRCI